MGWQPKESKHWTVDQADILLDGGLGCRTTAWWPCLSYLHFSEAHAFLPGVELPLHLLHRDLRVTEQAQEARNHEPEKVRSGSLSHCPPAIRLQ